jgi:succinate dehydrogenase / fumarate reductase, cytochrome b subunit
MCLALLKTSVGKKAVVSVTGLVLMGFLVAHLLGNLQIFFGPKWLNDYSEHLLGLPLLLWPARAILLGALILHMALSLQLAVQNRKARPVRYIKEGTVQVTIASRSMVLSGLAIFLFIVYHLMHFTWRTAHPEVAHLTDPTGRHDVYSMVVLSFQNTAIASVYIAAMFVLCMHLRHGSYSFLQSLGWTPEGEQKRFRLYGESFAWLIFLGYVSIPGAVWLGLLKPLQAGL